MREKITGQPEEPACGAAALQMESLLNSVPGGVAVYKVEDGKCRTLLFSDGLAAISGRTRQEYLDWVGDDAMQAVCPQDRDRVRKALSKAMETNGTISETCRIIHMNGDLLWVSLSGRKVREEDGCPVYHVVATIVSQEAQMYRQLLEGAPAGVGVFERSTHRALYANAALRELMHVEGDLADAPPVYCHRALLGRDTPCQDCCCRHMREDRFFSRVVQAPSGRSYRLNSRLLDWNGVPAYIVYVSDITRQLREERRIRSRYADEENKRRMLSKNVLVLCVFNVTQGKLISCDFSIVRPDDLKLRFGMPMEEALEYLLANVVDEKDRAFLRAQYNREALLERYHHGQLSGSREYRRDNRQDDQIWVSNEYSLVEEPESKDVICYIYVRSINQQKQYEQMLGTIVGLNYDFALLIDCRTGRAASICQRGQLPENALPRARDPEQARADLMRRICIDEDVEDLIRRTNMESVTAALERQPTYSVTFTILENGMPRHKEMGFAYLDETRRKLCCVRHDITALVTAQQQKSLELSEALRQAREAGQAKDEFLSRMSHDIRTPLNAIIGLTNLALTDTREQGTRDYLNQIDSSGKYLLSLVNDILDMTKITSRKMEFHPETYTRAAWTETLQAVIGEQCRQKGVRFTILHFGEGPPAVTVDKLRFNQIFFNLLSNAVKFTPPGGEVTVEIHYRLLPDGGCHLKTHVRDTGVGMSPDFLGQAFEAFAQERTDAAHNAGGTGLGLAIVKNLVELMGGTVALESSPGRGTCATVALDLAPAGALWEDSFSPDTPAPAPLEGRRILLAEDHPVNTLITRRLLEKRGVTVDHAPDGKQAVERFAAAPAGTYDAVLMDIRMPVMDGLEAARAIRRLPHPDAVRVPIIAMTANAFGDDVLKSREAGMDLHLAKPIEPEKLYEALAEQINRRTG